MPPRSAQGAAYEAYVDGAYRDGGRTGTVSKVWFSIADGVLTETMYGLIHEAQIKQMRLAVATDSGLAVEGTDTDFAIDYLHKDAEGRPLSPAYRVTTTDKAGRFAIDKQVFTDPDGQALILRVTVRALKGGVTPYVLLEPHMANTGVDDRGEAAKTGLFAHEGAVHLALRPSAPFEAASVGFMGVSDGLTGLKAGGLPAFTTTGETAGNIMLTGALPRLEQGQSLSRDFVIGFGDSRAAAERSADAAFATGLDEVLKRFNGEGERVGWSDYVASLQRTAARGGPGHGRRQAGLRLGPDAEGAGGPHPRRRPDRLAVQPVGRHGGRVEALDRLQGRLAARLLSGGHGLRRRWATGTRRWRPSTTCRRSRSGRTRPATRATAAGSCRRPTSTARWSGWRSRWTRRPCPSCWATACGPWAGCPTPTCATCTPGC